MFTDRLKAVREKLLSNKEKFFYNYYFSSCDLVFPYIQHREEFCDEKQFSRLVESVDNDCGTSACIAGWTLAMFFFEQYPKIGCVDIIDWEAVDNNISDVAMGLLDLGLDEAEFLFYAQKTPLIRRAFVELYQQNKHDEEIDELCCNNFAISPPSFLLDWFGKEWRELQFAEAIARIDYILNDLDIAKYDVVDSPLYSRVLEFVKQRIGSVNANNS